MPNGISKEETEKCKNKDEKSSARKQKAGPLTQAAHTSDEVRPLWFWQRPQATARGQIETKMVLMNAMARAKDQNEITSPHILQLALCTILIILTSDATHTTPDDMQPLAILGRQH